MKLVFLGTGSAFTVGDNYQSNMFFEDGESQRLLVDCGGDARHAMRELGLGYNDFEAIYVSHLHADHVGGLEWFAFSRHFDPQSPGKPQLLADGSIMPSLWVYLSGGLSSLDDIDAQLGTYFEPKVLKDGDRFNWSSLTIETFQTRHQISNHHLMPSFGLQTEADGLNVLVTTDTRMAWEGDPLYERYLTADIIFQDCETSPFKSTVHAHYTELLELPAEIRGKMWLYHYQPGELPDARADGFRGFARKGQVFDFQDTGTLS